MKLILTREVKGLGSAGEIVTVKDGYGRNFLIPSGTAIAWSKGGETQIEGIKRARSAREIRDADHANQVKATLEGCAVVVKGRAGSEGRLFGSITDKEIVSAIKSATGIDLDRHKVSTGGHIKKVGRYDVKATLHLNVVAQFSITVIAE